MKTRKSSRVKTIIFVTFVAILVTLFASVRILYNRHQAGYEVVGDNESDFIIDMKFDTLNMRRGWIKVQYMFHPSDEYADRKNDMRLRQDVYLVVNGNRKQFEAGKRMKPAVIKHHLIGKENFFPFDVHKATLDFTLEDLNMNPIPFKFQLSENLFGYDMNESSLHFQDHTVNINIIAKRSIITKLFTLVVTSLQWAICFVVLNIVVFKYMVAKTGSIPPGSIRLIAVMIVTFKKIRDIIPGIPSVGIALDRIGYFANIVLLNFLYMLALWIMLNRVFPPKNTKILTTGRKRYPETDRFY